MQAIILADRESQEIQPLDQDYAVATLPIAGKPIIQHVIENCQSSGVTEVIVVVRKHAERIKALLADGKRWSTKIRYVHIKQNQSYSSVLQQLGKQIEYPCIAVRGDLVYKHWLKLDKDLRNNESPIAGNLRTGIVTLHSQVSDIDALQWPVIRDALMQFDDPTPWLHYYPIDSLENYHRASIFAISGLTENREQAGTERHANIRLGCKTTFEDRYLLDGKVFVDDYSQVLNHCKISQHAYIGKHCIIDQGVELKNCVVLDNSYIGGGLQVENAIVYKQHMIRIDLQSKMQITDPMLLNSTELQSSSWGQRLFAILLAIVLLPLIMIGLINKQISKRQSLAKGLSDRGHEGNSDRGHEGNSDRGHEGKVQSHNYWGKSFVQLLDVVAGRLNLFGVEPDHQVTDSAWKGQFCKLPAGILSFAQCQKHKLPSDEAYELMEIAHSKTSRFDSSKWLQLLSSCRNAKNSEQSQAGARS